MKTFESYLNLAIEKFFEYLPSVIGAIIAVIFGLWLIKFVTKKLRKILEKRQVDEAIRGFAISITNILLKLLLFVTIITKLGVETTSFAAIIGAAGLAIGLALQGSLSNFAGGVLIILLKPFRIGDFIEAQGTSGTVKEISLFYTIINTFGNQRVVIPNGQLSNNKVTNYSYEPTRRDSIKIGISYGSDIAKARQVLLKLIDNNNDILKDPEPQVVVTELADSSVNLSVRFWAKIDQFWDAHWFVLEQSKIELEAAGIQIPFPQSDVNLYTINKND